MREGQAIDLYRQVFRSGFDAGFHDHRPHVPERFSKRAPVWLYAHAEGESARIHRREPERACDDAFRNMLAQVRKMLEARKLEQAELDQQWDTEPQEAAADAR